MDDEYNFNDLDGLSFDEMADSLIQSKVKLVKLQTWLLNKVQAGDSDIDFSWAMETLRHVAESRIDHSKR